MADIIVEVQFRSGEIGTFSVPKTITLEEFGALAALVDDTGVRTFKVRQPPIAIPLPPEIAACG